MKWMGLAAAFVLTGCLGAGEKTNIELIQDMMNSPTYKAQEGDPSSPSLTSARVPPEGSVPQGFEPYRHHMDPEGASGLKNPVPVSEASLALGKKNYEIFCLVCHGTQGKGDGLVAAKMPVKVPELLSDKVRGWSDGRIFHVITDGQGIMGSYASQIPESKDRWAIVNYIRQLQKAK